MAKINLGRVVGRDGGFGNITSSYIDDGGDPDVLIEASGEDSAKDVHFTFMNLINEPLPLSEIDKITNDTPVDSSKPVSGSGITALWQRIRQLFAPKNHIHTADDVTDGEFPTYRIADEAITAPKIADGQIGSNHLDQDLRDSISHVDVSGLFEQVVLDLNPNLARCSIYFQNGELTYNGKVYDQVQANFRFNGTFGIAGRLKGTSTYEQLA